uniref:Gibberellin-regulated protein 29 n=1 Tax=Glycine max TaxID=3847 RepID=K7MP20_SOYBN
MLINRYINIQIFCFLIFPYKYAHAQTQGSLLQQIDCNGACAARCRLSSRPRLCQRACGTCCRRCNCVPPGTAGNQEVCPCYASLTTHGGKRKCP